MTSMPHTIARKSKAKTQRTVRLPASDTARERVTIRLDAPIFEELRQLAFERRVTHNSIATKAVERELAMARRAKGAAATRKAQIIPTAAEAQQVV